MSNNIDSFDILIIGSGGAGLTSALSVYEDGFKIGIVSKSYPNNSQTSMAQGGINASISESDSIASHIEDTLKSAKGLGDKEAIELLCKEAPKVIEWLDSIGMPFSRINSNIAQRQLGGTKQKRACYAEDYTGLKILQTLIDNVINRDITLLNNKFLLDLIVEDSKIIGVKLLNIETSEIEVIKAKSVILATGGYSKIYGEYSTNSKDAIGSGISVALRSGVKISNMEFIQFHPTALKSSSILISESARGEGGILINSDNERFVDELSTRDEVARAIYLQMQKNKSVFLDLRKLDKNFLMENLPQEIKLAKLHENIDVFSEPIPIKPSAHYSIGGINVNLKCETNIEGLYAVGECTNAKVHGANRLGGNSLLEIIVFGLIAGNSAKEYIKDKNFSNFEVSDYNNINFIDELLKDNSNLNKNFYKEKHKLSKLLYEKVGLFRDEVNLNEALNYVNNINLSDFNIKDKNRTFNTELIEFLEFKDMIEIAKVVIKSAIERRESIGVHFRSDGNKSLLENYL